MPFLGRNNKTPLGIYIHVPFCRSKCQYCDFYSVTDRDDKLLDGYLDAVCAHIKEAGALAPEYVVDTIYFGGGTPSFVGADALAQLTKYQADWAILSVDGVSVKGGITTHHAEEAGIDRMMIAGARSAWVVVDHTKIGRAGFVRVCDDTNHVGMVTTDVHSEALRELEDNGMHIVYA